MLWLQFCLLQLSDRRRLLFRIADVGLHGLFTQRIKGKPVGGFERLQIGEIHLRRHPQQRALNIHLDRRAQLRVLNVPRSRRRNRLILRREWRRGAQ